VQIDTKALARILKILCIFFEAASFSGAFSVAGFKLVKENYGVRA